MNTEEQTTPTEMKAAITTEPAPPDTLHELLGMALEDFKKVLKNPKYRVTMDIWYKFNAEEDICYVCLAGAFVSQRMKPKGNQINWHTISAEWYHALEALNSVRACRVPDALIEYYCKNFSPGEKRGQKAVEEAIRMIDQIEGSEGHPLGQFVEAFDYANPKPFLKYLETTRALLEEANL